MLLMLNVFLCMFDTYLEACRSVNIYQCMDLYHRNITTVCLITSFVCDCPIGVICDCDPKYLQLIWLRPGTIVQSERSECRSRGHEFDLGRYHTFEVY